MAPLSFILYGPSVVFNRQTINLSTINKSFRNQEPLQVTVVFYACFSHNAIFKGVLRFLGTLES